MPFFFACFFTPGGSAGLPAGFARRWSGTARRLSQRGPNFLAGQRPHLGRQRNAEAGPQGRAEADPCAHQHGTACCPDAEPRTGDNASLMTWVGILLVCGTALAGLYVYKKRKQK